MELLERFYNEKVKEKNSPEFKELSPKWKKFLSNSEGFAEYRLSVTKQPASKALFLFNRFLLSTQITPRYGLN